MVLSKKLRVFFLSVLVVVFAVSSAFALDELDFGSAANGDEGNTDDITYAGGALTFKKSGYLVLPNQLEDGTEIELDTITLNADATEVELRLPDPFTNLPAEGMHGKWKIVFADGTTQTFTVKKHGGANAAIILEGDYVDDDTNYWEVPSTATLIIDAPVRATSNTNPFSLHAVVEGQLTFDRDSNVYGEGSLQPRGFYTDGTNVLNRSLFEVEDGGTLTVRVHTALQRDLDVKVSDTGTLVIDVTDSEHELEGAVLTIDGYIQVDKNLRISDGDITTGHIDVSETTKTLKKTGSATLTLGSGILNDIDPDTLALRNNVNSEIKLINVLAGTLKLDGTAEYNPNSKTPKSFASMHLADVTFTINGGTLDLATRSVQQKDAASKVLFNVLNGNLILANHAVYALDLIRNDGLYKEIYPYEDYYTKDNAMRIDVGDANDGTVDAGAQLDVAAAGAVTINGGFQAFNKVTGVGPITINNTDGDDKGGIIFVGGVKAVDVVEDNFNDFTGTISGTNANVGLWSAHFTEGLFAGATVSADNLILYGYGQNNTVLDIRESNYDTINSGFNHIYLRSDRPGADNSDPKIKNTMLTIGKVSFTGIDRVGGLDDDGNPIIDADEDGEPDLDAIREASPNYVIKSLKVDSTHVEERAGVVDTDGGYRIVTIDKVQLYANKDLDFSGDFRPLTANDAKGMYAIRLGAGYDADDNADPMSTIYWNADGVTGDGDEEDVDAIFSVKILEKANVVVTSLGTEGYSFAKNNSVLVKRDGKLEFPSGAKIGGNLTLETSTVDLEDVPNAVRAWYEDDDQPLLVDRVTPNMDYPREEYFVPYHAVDLNDDGEEEAFSQKWWNNDKLGCFTVLTTRLTKASRRDNAGGSYAVTVEGTLALSGDAVANPNTPAAMYPGRVMVRVKPDLDILDASEATVGDLTNGGQRFKIAGKEGSDKTNDFVPVYNAIYGFRIPRENANSANTGGVIFELRRNVGQLTLQNWEFTEDGYGDEFGAPNGHNFKIRIYYDQKGTIPDNTDTWDLENNAAGSDGFDDDGLVTYFGDYKDGVEHTTGQENVLDEGDVWYATGGTLEDNKPGRAYVSNDIQFTAHLYREAVTDRSGVEHDGYIELVGTSYQQVVRLPKIAIARNRIYPFERYLDLDDDRLKSFPFVPASPALYSMYVVPSYKQYVFAPEGYNIPGDGEGEVSKVTPEVKDSATVVEGSEGSVSFLVPGMWKAPNNAAQASAVLTDNGYVWNYGISPNDMYYMKDSNGRDVRVNNLVIRVYEGLAALDSVYRDYPAESFDIEVTAEGAVISMPAAILGTVTKFSEMRQVSLIGTRADGTGTIYTNPVTYTLLASTVTGDPIAADDLNLTFTIGDEIGVQKHYGIDYADFNVTDGNSIHLIPYDLPSWLTFDGHGDIISYTVTGTPDASEVGTHTYRVLAYAGDNSSTNQNYKMYTFTVTVVGAPAVSVSATNLTVEAGKTGTITITVSGGDDDTLRAFAITALGTASTSIFDKTSGINILGNSTATITVTSDQTLGTFEYYLAGGGLSTTFKVTVREPDPASLTINDPADGYDNQFGSNIVGYTYHAVFSATAENFEGEVPEIEFTFVPGNDLQSELYAFQSTDVDEDGNVRKLFVVEGPIKGNVDSSQTFRIEAKAGNVEAEPVDVEFTVEEDPNADFVTYPNTGNSTQGTITFTGSSEAVTAGYTAMLPVRTLASDPYSDITLPLWLKPVYGSGDDEDYIIGLEFAGATGNLVNNSKATVRIYAEYTPAEDEELDEDDDGYRYYGWDVVYAAKPADLGLTLTPASLTLAVGGTATATAAATDAQGDVVYTLSKDEALSWITMSGATITAANPTAAGTYTVTVIAQDSRGVSGQATAALTIKVTSGDEPGPGPQPTEMTISADPTSVTFDSPTADAKTVTMTSNLTGTTYTATVSPSTGLTASVSESTITLTPSVAGSYTVTITGKNGTQSKTATVNVTVESGSGPIVGNDFMLTASDESVSVALNATNTSITLTPRNVQGTVTYSSSASWVTVDDETGVVTIRPTSSTLVGVNTVTITGTDSPHTNGNATDTVTLTITVTGGRVSSSGGGGCDAGFGALALVLAAPLFLRRRRS